MAAEEELANVKHFNSECIYDSGDYTSVASRIIECADEALPIQKMSDRIDHEKHEVIFQCSIDGKQHEWKLDLMKIGSFVILLSVRQLLMCRKTNFKNSFK